MGFDRSISDHRRDPSFHRRCPATSGKLFLSLSLAHAETGSFSRRHVTSPKERAGRSIDVLSCRRCQRTRIRKCILGKFQVTANARHTRPIHAIHREYRFSIPIYHSTRVRQSLDSRATQHLRSQLFFFFFHNYTQSLINIVVSSQSTYCKSTARSAGIHATQYSRIVNERETAPAVALHSKENRTLARSVTD